MYKAPFIWFGLVSLMRLRSRSGSQLVPEDVVGHLLESRVSGGDSPDEHVRASRQRAGDHHLPGLGYGPHHLVLVVLRTRRQGARQGGDGDGGLAERELWSELCMSVVVRQAGHAGHVECCLSIPICAYHPCHEDILIVSLSLHL